MTPKLTNLIAQFYKLFISASHYVYRGCWNDGSDDPNSHGNRVIQSLENTNDILDGVTYKVRLSKIEKCFDVAFSKGFKVFGIHDHGECIGDEMAWKTYMLHGPSLKCSSGGEGGLGANSIYAIRKGHIVYVYTV